MSFSAIPVPETTIGLAREETRGTPVAPTHYIPVMGPKYKPDLTLMPDETLQGSMVKVYDEVPGLRYDMHGWDGYLYLDSFPLFIQALLGSSDTVTTAPSNTTLSSSAVAGATMVDLTGAVVEGDWIVIDEGVGLMETHQVSGVTGSGPYVATLTYPLAYNHESGAAVTGLTGHTFSLLNNSPSTGNQPASYTITDFAGESSWRQLPRGQLEQLSISGGTEQLTKYTVSWLADAAITPSAPSPSFTTIEAVPGWTLQTMIGGTQVGYVVSWDLSFSRQTKPVPAITGTQRYFQYFASALLATAKLTVLEDPSATWLDAYEAADVESLDLVLSDVESGFALNVHSSRAKFTSGELDRSKEWVEVPLEMQFLPTSTDALAGGVSPTVMTVANATTEEY